MLTSRWTLVTLVVLTLLVTVTSHGDHHQDWRDSKVENKLHDPKVVQDAEHIKEHLSEQANLNETAMSKEELEFHYFKMHDFDNNTRLDGLEILQALSHMMPFEEEEERQKLEKEGKNHEEMEKTLTTKREEWLRFQTDIIDKVFQEDDADKDGYLNYFEYLLARRRGDKQAEENKKKMEEKND